jgi:hypothetical protein
MAKQTKVESHPMSGGRVEVVTTPAKGGKPIVEEISTREATRRGLPTDKPGERTF